MGDATADGADAAATDATAAGDGTTIGDATATAVDSASDSETHPNVCAPNHDGQITRAEIPIAPDLQATFLVAANVTFDTRATTSGAGPSWDLSGSYAGDAKVLVEPLDPAEQWFGADFPNATYATKLAADSTLLGVFQAKDDGLYLLGVASAEDGLTKTELTYTPPAKLLGYPLAVAASWTSTSTVSGLTSGVATLATETYSGTVDARGTVKTPFADFDALRVIVTLNRWIGAVFYNDVQQLFVTECFGTIASVRSAAYQTGPEFTSAAELRRLSP